MNDTERLENLLRKAPRLKVPSALREKLQAGRMTAPLFDIDRFRRHIESAYLTMYERHLAGAAPASFDVTANFP